MESYLQTVEALRPHTSGNANISEKQKPARAVKSKPGKKKRYEIDVFSDWCKCCGICAAFCPRGCIRLDDQGAPTRIDPDQCTGCGWCELHCPDLAISVHTKKAKQERKSPRTGCKVHDLELLEL